MSEIPDDIKQAGRLEAEFYAKWLHAGNSRGSLSPHAIDGLADSFSRLILSERQRLGLSQEECAALIDKMLTEPAFSDHPRTKLALTIAARAIRRGRHLESHEKMENLMEFFANREEVKP